MKRIIAAIVIFIGFIIAWQLLSVIKIKVIGQPSSTGLIATELEQPFFTNLKNITDLPIEIDFKPVDTIGFKDTYQLPLMKEGEFDLVSLRLVQNIQHEITLNGLDLIGLDLDVENARALAYAYLPVVDKHLQEKYHVKVLGLWTFGPQVLFCAKPIRKLADFKGVKIRVSYENMAKFISTLGGVPALLSFDETKRALQNQIIDCAITSATSAYSAGWLEYTKYYVPFTFNTGINAYTIALSKWHLLTDKQQEVLQSAFNEHTNKIWQYSQKLLTDTENCMFGKDDCKAQRYKFIKVDLSPEDQAYIHKQFLNVSFKQWAEACNQEYPLCEREWLNLVGPFVGLK